MRTQVKKWGNSAAIRLPAGILDAARLELDSAVDVTVEGGRIVIDAVRAPQYDIETLIAGITPENRHAETDWGPPVGAEIF
jgi:antitoxin MazE